MIAIVLVGGKKSLISELHLQLPAPLIPVAGEPFLFWVTHWLKTQGCTHIVFSACHHAEKISAFAQQMASIDPKLCLDVVVEPRPLGTAGAAAFCAKRYPSEPLFIVNGDSLLLTNVRYAISRLKKQSKPDGIIFGTRLNNAGQVDTLEIDNEKRLLSFREKQPGFGLTNGGIYLLRNELLSDISLEKESSLELEHFPRWIKENKHIEVIDAAEPFIDIDTPNSLMLAEKLIRKYQPMLMTPKSELVEV